MQSLKAMLLRVLEEGDAGAYVRQCLLYELQLWIKRKFFSNIKETSQKACSLVAVMPSICNRLVKYTVMPIISCGQSHSRILQGLHCK
jgi:hypothetical protein